MEIDDGRSGDMMPLGEIDRDAYIDTIDVFYYQNFEVAKNVEQARNNEFKIIETLQETKAMFGMLLSDGNEEKNENVTTCDFEQGIIKEKCSAIHTVESMPNCSEQNENETCLEYQNKEEFFSLLTHTDEDMPRLTEPDETKKCHEYQIKDKNKTIENKYFLSELNEKNKSGEHQKKDKTVNGENFSLSELNENINMRDYQKEDKNKTDENKSVLSELNENKTNLVYQKEVRMSDHKTNGKKRRTNEPQRKRSSRKKMAKTFIQIANKRKCCLYEAYITRLKSGLQQNTCYSNRRLCSVLFLLLFACPVHLIPVEWSLKNAPVEFGSTAILGCHTQERNGCNNTWRWVRGDATTFLSYDGIESNKTKYKEVLGENCTSSYLNIYYFTIDDLNVNYTCFHGFKQMTKSLELRENLFESLPTNGTTQALLQFENGILESRVSFMKLFPVPNCTFIAQNMSLPSYTNQMYDKTGIFVNINYSMSFRLTSHSCKGSLVGVCRFGTSGKYVFNQTFNHCKEFHADDHKTIVILAIVIVLMIVIVVIIVVTLIARNKSNRRHTDRQLDYSSVQLDVI